MRTGKLRHRVEIKALTIGEDEIGNPIQEWVTLATAWASIEPLKGREYWAATQVQAETTHKVTMRHPRVEVKPSNLLILDDRTLKIESVINVEERNRELVLMCKEKME